MPSAAHSTLAGPASLAEPVVHLVGESSGRTRIARTLRRTLGRGAFVDDIDGLEDPSRLAVLGLHNEGLTSEERTAVLLEADRRVSGPLVVVLAKPLGRDELATLFEAGAVHNMHVINSTGVDASDLLATLHKLRTGDLFGPEPYFRPAFHRRSMRVVSSRQRDDVLHWVDGFASDLGVASRLRSLLRLIADELVTNALYNAPTSEDGAQPFARRPRTEAVELDATDAVELSVCCDGERFGLASRDPFGSLSVERVHRVLARGYRRGSDQVVESTGGAGVGLYGVLAAVSQLVINIDPGRATELIGILDVRGSYKDFACQGTSFNTFVNGMDR